MLYPGTPSFDTINGFKHALRHHNRASCLGPLLLQCPIYTDVGPNCVHRPDLKTGSKALLALILCGFPDDCTDNDMLRGVQFCGELWATSKLLLHVATGRPAEVHGKQSTAIRTPVRLLYTFCSVSFQILPIQ